MSVFRAALLASMLSAQAAADARIQAFDQMIAAGRYAEAEKALEGYVTAHPDSAQALYQLGYVYFRMHKIWPSVKVLSQSLSLDVNNAEAHKILGMNFTILKRNDLAKKEFRDAVKLKPGSAEIRYSLARVLYEEGAYAEAAAQFNHAIQIAPGYTKAHHNLGLTYEALNQLAKAREHFERALALNLNDEPRSEWPYINFASFHNRRGDFAAARKLLEHALALRPESDEAHFQMAKALRGMNRLEECVSEIQKAIAINAGSSEFFYVLAQVQRRLGKHEEAGAALEQFHKLKKWEAAGNRRMAGDEQ
jgi:tetratricopeptide (TPR) repeat protein